MDAISLTLLICKNKTKNLPRNQYLRDSNLWNKRSDFYLKRWPNGLAKQKQNLRTDLRLVAKRIRKSHCKFPQVAKSRKLHPHTVYLRSTCAGLRWVAKRWKTCVRIWARTKSTQVNAYGWPNETRLNFVNLRRFASPFGQGFNKQCTDDVITYM